MLRAGTEIFDDNAMDEAVEALTAMGFPKGQAMAACQVSY
jgi:hypothetical protein